MKGGTIVEVVEKLIGYVNPVGDSNEDSKRFENLKELCYVVDMLLGKISSVTGGATSGQHSVKKAADYANKFLKDVKAD